MSVLYVKEQGAVVKKLGERVLVVKNNQTLLDIPLIRVENIAVIGNVQITTQALHMFIEQGIDVGYFTIGGKYLGHTCADSSKNIFLRFSQYRFYLNEEQRLSMARILVDNKIKNQMTLIKEHRWDPNDTYDRNADLSNLEKHRLTIESRKTSGELMGLEGICSQIYFSAFGHMLKGDFTFEKRSRRPPKDPVNIILSLSYTFLTREVSNALDAESFEMYLGFLHGIRYGRKSLALDLVEEFRQPCVDRFVILMFNKRIFSKYDFEEDESGIITLNEDGFKKFCHEYERWVTGRNTLAGDHFRKRIEEQAGKLKKAITENSAYEPYVWRKTHVPDQL